MYTIRPARKIAATMKMKVVSGKSVPGAFPPPLEPPPPPLERANPATPAAAAFFALALSLPLPLPPLPLLFPLAALLPEPVDGEMVAVPEPPPEPPPEPLL
jgi:hypothetical protein